MGKFREQFENDLQLRGLSPNTVETYVSCIKNLVKFYGRSPDTLTVDDVRAFQLYLTKEREVACSTFNIYTYALRSFFLKTLNKNWKIDLIPYQKTGRRLPEILNAEELCALFGNTANLKHRVLLETTYSAGLRVSEVVHLKISDIDSQRMMIRIAQGKGKKDRYVPLSEVLLPELRRYWKRVQSPDWLFQGQKPSTPLGKKSAERIFTEAKNRAGITKNVAIHSLRHAFATHLLESGVDIRTIQRLLGHRSLTSTMVYIHVAKSYVNQAGSPLDKLSTRFGTLLPPSED